MPMATLNMVVVDRRQKAPLQSQLYRQIRELIMTGHLKAGIRLPSTRDLVNQLGVSRNTIVYALDQLIGEGYLRSRAGSGIYVEDLPRRENPVASIRLKHSEHLSSSFLERANQLLGLGISPRYLTDRVRPFRPCQPASDHFPMRNWNRARAYALRTRTKELLIEGDVAGLPRLRAALATYLHESRGVRCTADQIIVTAGTQGLADDCVIYTSSFSKVLFPSLRLGYLVAPARLIELLRKAKEVHDGSTTGLDQATAAIFIEEGFFSTHVRRMRKLYRERRDAFLHEANKHLSGVVTFPKVEAGMDVIGTLPANEDDQQVSQLLASRHIDVPPLSAYSLKSKLSGLVFGFTAFSESQTRSSIRSIAEVIRKLR